MDSGLRPSVGPGMTLIGGNPTDSSLSIECDRGRCETKTMPARKKKSGYLIQPDPLDPRLSERVTGFDQTGARVETAVVVERALTIFLNSQEILTAMTIGDYPEYLAIGYLLNQHMLLPNDTITAVDYDEDLAVV